jgi:hypothetical protein
MGSTFANLNQPSKQRASTFDRAGQRAAASRFDQNAAAFSTRGRFSSQRKPFQYKHLKPCAAKIDRVLPLKRMPQLDFISGFEAD